MNLPVSFLLGLAVVLLHDQLTDILPGAASGLRLLPLLLLLPVPFVLAKWNTRRLVRVALDGQAPPRTMLALVRLQSLSVPAIYAMLVIDGGLPDLVERWAPVSQVGQMTLMLAPLLLMEVSLRLAERAAIERLETAGIGDFSNLGPGRLSMAFFLLAPILIFAIASDVILHDRRLEVFFRATAPGTTGGLVLVIAFLCVALPLLFRWIMPTHSDLPARVADDVRSTAARLGFRSRAVLSMHTGLRMVNAALVGPLPWPRYLVLTDGLLAYLDPAALRGVVAHEVGHARAGHPAILLLVFGCVPVLLLHPLSLIELDDVAPGWLLAGGGVALLAGFAAIRAVAHRFEYEADQLSAEALGGAEPCIAALQRVGELFPHHRSKSSFRHPSDESRIRNLIRWEEDPDFLAVFRRRGRDLRTAIVVLVIAALAVSIWAHASSWPIDRTVYLLYSGDFRGAKRELQSLPPNLPAVYRKDVERLGEEVDAAVELCGDGGEWSAIRDDLAERAWRRGREVLAMGGPVAARPWFALALSREVSSPLEQSLYLYCSAAAGEDAERMARLRAHILTLGVPQDIGDALPP